MSTPGRIDIVDGETRYESARSLVEHGDFAIRNDRIWFGVFPGRDKMRHTSYRLPQIILGAPAIVLSDTTGPRSEPRRHFFFTLTSAVAAATLAPLYAIWFRHRGRSPRTAVVLGVFGVLANPSWFYGTSTFDDILGTTALVAVVVFGFLCRDRTPSMA